MAEEPTQLICFPISTQKFKFAYISCFSLPEVEKVLFTSHCKAQRYGDTKFQNLVFRQIEIVTLLYAHCSFDPASSKANSPSSLGRPNTKASTQNNLQTHPPLPRALLVRLFILSSTITVSTTLGVQSKVQQVFPHRKSTIDTNRWKCNTQQVGLFC